MLCHDLKLRHREDERGVTWRASGATRSNKKVVKLLRNLGLDRAFGKQGAGYTGQITVKLAATGALTCGLTGMMFCMPDNQKHNMQVQPNCFWMFLVISKKYQKMQSDRRFGFRSDPLFSRDACSTLNVNAVRR